MFNAVNGKKCSNSLKVSNQAHRYSTLESEMLNVFVAGKALIMMVMMCSFYGCECRLHRLAGNRMNTCRKGAGCCWDGKEIFMD